MMMLFCPRHAITAASRPPAQWNDVAHHSRRLLSGYSGERMSVGTKGVRFLEMAVPRSSSIVIYRNGGSHTHDGSRVDPVRPRRALATEGADNPDPDRGHGRHLRAGVQPGAGVRHARVHRPRIPGTRLLLANHRSG